MYWLGLSVQITCVALQSWILVLLWRRNLWRKFPIFTGYIAYVVLRTIVGSATLSNPHVYFYFYWISAPGEMILMILAAHESFLKVFRSFYLLWWFRIFFPGAIVAAVVYSAWKGYASPPVHVSASGAAIISAALTAQYVILAISILFFVLAKFLHLPWKIHEYRFVLGFGISSLAVAFAGAVRSEFGTRFEFVSEMLPAVAYMVALAVWLSAVLHAERSSDQPSERLSPEDAVSDLRRQLLAIRSFLKKG
jgi:hypothetical protein